MKINISIFPGKCHKHIRCCRIIFGNDQEDLIDYCWIIVNSIVLDFFFMWTTLKIFFEAWVHQIKKQTNKKSMRLPKVWLKFNEAQPCLWERYFFKKSCCHLWFRFAHSRPLAAVKLANVIHFGNHQSWNTSWQANVRNISKQKREKSPRIW